MKKFLSGFLLVCLFFPLSAVDLKIGTDDWEPYEYYADSSQTKVTGYSTEIIEAVLKSMKQTYEPIVIYPWARAEEMVFTGKIDILFSGSYSDKRAENVYFPEEPLISSDWVMFVLKKDAGKNKYSGLSDLKGKKIGVVKDYAYTPEFWDYIKKECTYEEVPTDETNFKKLSSGRIDYIISEFPVGMAIARKLGMSNDIIAYTKAPIKSTGLFVYFSKKTMKDSFVKEFSAALKKFKTTKEFQVIFDKYMK